MAADDAADCARAWSSATRLVQASGWTIGPASGWLPMRPTRDLALRPFRQTRPSAAGVARHPPPTSSSTGSTAGVTPGPATASRCPAPSSVVRAAPSTRRRSSGTSSRPTAGRHESSEGVASDTPVTDDQALPFTAR
jgi:hypothetical protein